MMKILKCFAVLGVAAFLAACVPDNATNSPPSASAVPATTVAVVDNPAPVRGMFPCAQAQQVFGSLGLKPDVSKLRGYCYGSGYMGDAGYDVLAGFDAGENLCAVFSVTGRTVEDVLRNALKLTWNRSGVLQDSLRAEEKMGNITPISFQPFAQKRHTALTESLPGGKVLVCYRHNATYKADDLEEILAVMKAIGA